MPAVRAQYSWIQQKERVAAEHGAVAVLTLKSPARERIAPWDRARRFRPLPAVSWVDESGSAATSLKATVTLGPDFAARLFEAAGKDLQATYAEAEAGRVNGFDLPGRFVLERRSSHQDTTSANVIGVLRGDDPVLANE